MDMLEIKYWKENKSLKDISKELGVYPWSVLYRMKKENIVRRGVTEARRKKILIKPDLSCSANLSYILAVLLGDGCVTSSVNNPRNKGISLTTVDEEFLDAFRASLEKIGLRPSKYQVKTREGGNNLFRTDAYSMYLYNWYKSLDKEEIRKIAFSYPLDFLRGIYDSEGCFYSDWIRVRGLKKLQLRCRIIIANIEEWLIELCKELAASRGFEFVKQKQESKKENRKDIYHITLAKRKEILPFLSEIEPSIPRKSEEKYFNVIKEREKNPELYAKIREE